MKIEDINVEEAIGHVGEVLSEHQQAKGLLIHALQQIQKTHNYLPEEELKRLSRKLSIPLSEIYSTATFYKQFYFTPRGKNIVCVCTGTACHVRGASEILDGLKKEFKVDEGETSSDGEVTLETVGCVGCCGLAPVVTVNESVIGDVGKESLEQMISTMRGSNGEAE
jgi:NADH:ubiquinone oxidoreductase subunit E